MPRPGRPSFRALFFAAVAGSAACLTWNAAEAHKRAVAAQAETVAALEAEAFAAIDAARTAIEAPNGPDSRGSAVRHVAAHEAEVSARLDTLDPNQRHFAQTYLQTLAELNALALDPNASRAQLRTAYDRARDALDRLIVASR